MLVDVHELQTRDQGIGNGLGGFLALVVIDLAAPWPHSIRFLQGHHCYQFLLAIHDGPVLPAGCRNGPVLQLRRCRIGHRKTARRFAHGVVHAIVFHGHTWGQEIFHKGPMLHPEGCVLGHEVVLLLQLIDLYWLCDGRQVPLGGDVHGAPLGGHKIQPPGGRRRRICGIRQLPRTPFATQGRSLQGSQIHFHPRHQWRMALCDLCFVQLELRWFPP
mmetsp:Transcript_75208/g.166114  ORF Transcript_75208/g.166114 Transcript_75208/m.166114 type:complete len:217 (+) Transcript_75208:428-1078(+)